MSAPTTTSTPWRNPDLRRILDHGMGAAVRRLRRSQRLTQFTLGVRCGLHPSVIGRVERGVENPTLLRLARIFDGLGYPMDVVLTELGIQLADQERAARQRQARQEVSA